jgi:hypothetical protein
MGKVADQFKTLRNEEIRVFYHLLLTGKLNLGRQDESAMWLCGSLSVTKKVLSGIRCSLSLFCRNVRSTCFTNTICVWIGCELTRVQEFVENLIRPTKIGR